jgi:diacylglycerol kinase (ATP)
VNPTEPLLLITNEGAGTTDRQAIDAATAVLEGEGPVEERATGSPDELDDLLAESEQRRIVVAGGDGSLHAVVAALHRAGRLGEVELGLLPLGTGNDFARTLGVPLEPEAAARTLVDGRARAMDLIVDDTGQPVVNSVHLGAGADAGRRGARWKERLGRVGVNGINLGKLGYPIGAALTTLNPPALRLRIEVDGEVVSDLHERVLMVALGNGASVGGGAELTPGADPADGRIDVIVATPRSLGAKARYAAGILLGRHPEHEDVLTLHAREVAVTAIGDSEFWCSADGELDGPFHRRSWRLEPAAYRIVAPVAEAGASGLGH